MMEFMYQLVDDWTMIIYTHAHYNFCVMTTTNYG